MSWGYKIIAVYLVFVTGIAIMVYKSSSQKIDLVTTDYYAKELKYQERIDAVKRTAMLSSKIKYEVKESKLLISLPAEFELKEVNGTAVMYYPADNSNDIKIDFTTNNRVIKMDIPASAKGAYQLQVSWINDGHDYYFEENLFL